MKFALITGAAGENLSFINEKRIIAFVIERRRRTFLGILSGKGSGINFPVLQPRPPRLARILLPSIPGQFILELDF